MKNRISIIVIMVISILFLSITKNYAVNNTKNVISSNNVTSNVVVDKEGLSSLNIKDVSLSPSFLPNVYEYKVKYIGEDTSLQIEAVPFQENYIVEITGNEKLVEGENIITILVSESTGENVATYQIIVNKSLVDEEAIAREQEEKEKERRQKFIIGASIVVVIFIIIIFFLMRKEKDFEDDYEDEDESEEDYENDMPKALKNDDIEYRNEECNDKDEEDDDEDDENFEEMPIEKVKEKFLNSYSNYEEKYDLKDNEEKRKTHHKGKRFK